MLFSGGVGASPELLIFFVVAAACVVVGVVGLLDLDEMRHRARRRTSRSHRR